jgi:penicillin-binding protein 2
MRLRGTRKRKKRGVEIYPDEILIDSKNIAALDTDRLEGRLEQPLGRRTIVAAAATLVCIFTALTIRAGDLQVVHGEGFAQRAQENQLSETTLFADRGIITDRNGIKLAWNEKASPADDFATRVYTNLEGLAHVIGYLKPPAKDSSGFYYQDTFLGVDGAEKAFAGVLAGQNGTTLTETDARGAVVSKAEVRPPTPGTKIALSVDANLSDALYRALAQRAQDSHFQGGAGVIMDVRTGELLALVSYPEFSPSIMTNGSSTQKAQELNDSRRLFLNRAVSGLYAPGSIVKPFVAVGALNEGVIDESKQILSTGSISLPNPYDPAHPSVFKDWRPNGWVDVRHAIAVSSDVYFYEVGGGFQSQPGLGIANIDKYLRLFGFGQAPGLEGFSQEDGTIPTPQWKEENFPGDPWRIGDTYHTAIGQYGFQATPLQAVRAVAAIANGGTLFTPTLLASTTGASTKVPVSSHALQVVREGMRLGVTEGIAGAVKKPYVAVAAKTGTAQVGVHNEFLNSWMVGFFPYDNPQYAYAIVLERGPAGTVTGAPAAMSTFLDWVHDMAPQYLQ